MDRREYLKPSRFGNAEKRRQLDTKNLKEKRSVRRTTNFNLQRNIEEIEEEVNKHTIENIPPKIDKALDRKLALQKFKAEREARKEALKNKKKPPFVVGIPHHGSSPLLRNLETVNVKKTATCNEVRNKRVTRATTRMVQGNVLKDKPKVDVQPRKKHVFKAPPSVKVFPFNENKSMFTFQAPQSTKKLTSPHTPTVLKRSAQKKPPLKPESSLAKVFIPKTESFEVDNPEVDVEALASPLKSESVEDEPAEAEKPDVKIASIENPATGRVAAEPTPIATELQDVTESTPTTELQVLTGSTPATERTENDEIDNENGNNIFSNQAAIHYERLQAETDRLLQLTDWWQALVLRDTLPQDVVDEVDSVVGQMRLLTGDTCNLYPCCGDSERLQAETDRLLQLADRWQALVLRDTLPQDVVDEVDSVVGQMRLLTGDTCNLYPCCGDSERLQAETDRLLQLADRWQALVLRDTLPQDVVDEVDSVVGQTRLLTGDKFQQFRRLVEEYEQQTGARPLTLEDLGGFWDMVYLQVVSLDKKYESLDTLKNNNWVKPEPVRKKKQRRAKKIEKKETETDKSSSTKPNKVTLQVPEVQEIRTPTTNVKPVISSILLSRKRTRSNSPSPYIAMRLSGIGRPSTSKAIDGTPKSELPSSEIPETPKSALKRSWSKRTERNVSKVSSPRLSSVNVKIEEAIEDPEPFIGDTEPLIESEEQTLPAVTPRRSVRLMAKLQTPVSCSACESVSCKKLNCMTDSASKRKKNSRKTLKFSPSQTQQNCDPSESTELKQAKEADLNKPSTSRVRFSLRPSVLTTVCENNNASEVPKKGTRKRQASVNTAGSTPAALESEELGTTSRRSMRQSRKVTFESGAEEKPSFKLPATPFRKTQADS